MVRAKARFIGNEGGRLLEEFSAELKEKLRTFYPDKNAPIDPVFGDPAEAFAEHLLHEAWWAKAEMGRLRHTATTKEVLKAELTQLDAQIETLVHNLRSISEDVDTLLGVQADPLGCADSLAELAVHIKKANEGIQPKQDAGAKEDAQAMKRTSQMQKVIAEQMVLRLLPVLREYGINTACSTQTDMDVITDAVRIFQLIGNDICLPLAIRTWANVLVAVKAAEAAKAAEAVKAAEAAKAAETIDKKPDTPKID